MRRYNLFWLALCLLLLSCVKTERADLVIHNARILSFDERASQHEAMAISDGRILELGAEHEIMNRYLGDEVIDMKKKFVIPGLIDNHAYFIEYGHLLANTDIRDYENWNDLIEDLKQKDDSILFAYGWNESFFKNSEIPSLQILDSIFSTKPIFVKHRYGFKALVNSASIECFGLETRSSIAKGEDLEKLDLWKDVQIKENLVRYYSLAKEANLKKGIICSSNLGLSLDVFTDLQEVSIQDENPIELNCYLGQSEGSFQFLLDQEPDSGTLRLLGMNVYFPLDSPYFEKAKDWAFLLKERNKQLVMHALGAEAMDQILVIAEENLGDVNDLRWRVENAHQVDMAQMPLFRKSTLIPGLCPLQDDQYDEVQSFQYHSLYDQNKILSLGTSCPVEKCDPWSAMSMTTTKADEALTFEQSLKAMTSWAALASFRELELGSLEAGKDASFITLKSDPRSMTSDQFSVLSPESVWLNSKMVFSK